jgi:anti-anti-sigma factor
MYGRIKEYAMSLLAPEIDVVECNAGDLRCCVCGAVLPYHPVFSVDHDCPACGSSIWCFQRDNGDEVILEVLPERTPALEDIDRLLQSLLRSRDVPHVTIDLSALDIVNSALVAMLVLMNKRIRAAGGTLRLCELTPVVLEIFRRFKLHTLFDIVDHASV